LIAGLVLLYVAIFLTETEENAIQNSLESWWVRLDDQRSTNLSRQTAFLQEIARLSSRGLDSVLGQKYFSLRAIAVSASLSVASLFVYLLGKQVIILFKNPGWIPEIIWPTRAAPDLRVFPYYAGFAIAFIALALAPLKFRQPRAQQWWYAAVLALSLGVVPQVAFVTAVAPYELGSDIDEPLALVTPVFVTLVVQFQEIKEDYTKAPQDLVFVAMPLGAVALSFAADLLFIAFTRTTFRAITSSIRAGRIVGLILLNMGCATALLVIPQWVGDFYLRGDGGDDTLAFVALLFKIFAATNLLDAFVSSIFGALCVVMLAHWLFWPVVQRPIYAAQKLGVTKRRGLLATSGVTLLAVATGKAPTVVQAVADALTK
jgi:hypothetical protein